jgi:hypothetical protein
MKAQPRKRNLASRLAHVRQLLADKVPEDTAVSEAWGDIALGERPSTRQVMRRAMRIDDWLQKNYQGDDVSEALALAKQAGLDVEVGDTDDPTAAPAYYRQLKLLEKVANPRALSVNYRVLAVDHEHIRAAAPFGVMRVILDLGIDGEHCVDAADFLGVLRTAPEQPFTVAVKDNALHWQCGKARGHLSVFEAQVPLPDYRGDLAPLIPDFGRGLELGASACGQSAVLRSAGLEGVQLYNERGNLYAVASDGMVVSSCCLGPALPMLHPDGQSVVTLKPQAAALLAELAQQGHSDGMFLGADDTSLYFIAQGVDFHIYQLAPLPLNFADKLAPFTGAKQAVPLLHETVKAFLRRAEMLAEVRREAMVELSVTKGRTTLAFREATGSTEEYYDIVSDGPGVTVQPVRIEARRIMRALEDASHLVFDYAKQNILILRGDNEFIFAIYGREP